VFGVIVVSTERECIESIRASVTLDRTCRARPLALIVDACSGGSVERSLFDTIETLERVEMDAADSAAIDWTSTC